MKFDRNEQRRVKRCVWLARIPCFLPRRMTGPDSEWLLQSFLMCACCLASTGVLITSMHGGLTASSAKFSWRLTLGWLLFGKYRMESSLKISTHIRSLIYVSIHFFIISQFYSSTIHLKKAIFVHSASEVFNIPCWNVSHRYAYVTLWISFVHQFVKHLLQLV